MSELLARDELRGILGVEVSDEDVASLLGWYAGFARQVAAYPQDDLKRVEPPLRSVPGPSAT